ncbi:zinc ribbon domain-containing protein [Desulfolutivibrio sp.]|uniref:zinc ribbon domain-containing protein n=1 Tax=Desulfolutivibrio sp. TaxID=2773296 RepID=UPI002F9611D6
MDFLVLWIGCGIAAAVVASNKGMNTAGWFVLGFFFGPIALIVALVLPKAGAGAGEKKCPYCAEYVKREAIICKHCGRNIAPADDQFHFE